MDLFPPAYPPGFRVVADVVPDDVERDLFAFLETLDYGRYVMHGTPSRREVAFFGYSYGDPSRGAAAPMPPVIADLRDRAAATAGLDPEPFVQALVNRYPPGAGIGWHRDVAQYGPTVLGVSLGSECRFQLRHREDHGRKLTIDLRPRSVYVIGGESRVDWEHHLPPVKTLRYSLTFRTLARGR